MVDRVVLFIDYQNAHGGVRRQFLGVNPHPSDGHFDPLRLGQLLVQRRRRPSVLEQVRIYRGRPNPNYEPRPAAANDRQAVAWERSGAVQVIRRPLRYPRDWPDTPCSEKGIDVALAIDVVTMGLRKQYDAAIVMSTDTDLLPAIETVYRDRLGHIELATWAGARRIRFPNTQLPYCHFVDRSEFNTLADTTDYTQA